MDASALLAFAQNEAGSSVVEQELEGSRVGAANWSEVAQKVIASGRDWELVRALFESFALRIEPVLASDAEWAARRWKPAEGLSLADRLCLALGERLDVPVLTADAKWGDSGRIRQIR